MTAPGSRLIVHNAFLVPVVFLAGRMILILSLDLGGVVGYGDYWNFFAQASLGFPYLDYWTEFPPVFPLVSSLVFEAVSGRETSYQYLLAILLSVVQALVIAVFVLLGERIHSKPDVERRAWIYALIAIGLPYTWWYFDVFAVLAMLMGLLWILRREPIWGGVAAGIGGLVKWFPLLLLILPWRFAERRFARRFSAIAAGVFLLPMLLLLARSPDLTLASLQAQYRKGSWETLWSLLEGKTGTGNFGLDIDRTDPEALAGLSGLGSDLLPWASLALFLMIGGALYLRVNIFQERSAVAFLGVAFCLFLIWSPGYSPQWALYLLPLILLALPERMGFLISLVFLGLNLLEWPVLLSRGYFVSLWLIIPLRLTLLILMALEFWRFCRLDPVMEASIDIPA